MLHYWWKVSLWKVTNFWISDETFNLRNISDTLTLIKRLLHFPILSKSRSYRKLEKLERVSPIDPKNATDFPKMYFLERGWSQLNFFLKILFKVLKSCRRYEDLILFQFKLFWSIFWIFLTFPCYKTTNDVSI